jgi:hypothetical protein
MKKRHVLAASLLLVSSIASAEYMHVVTFKLKPDCTRNEVGLVVYEAGQWGREMGLESRVAYPVYSGNPDENHWILSTRDSEAWGKAWNTWRNAIIAEDPLVTKINDAFEQCAERVRSEAFQVYPDSPSGY